MDSPRPSPIARLYPPLPPERAERRAALGGAATFASIVGLLVLGGCSNGSTSYPCTTTAESGPGAQGSGTYREGTASMKFNVSGDVTFTSSTIELWVPFTDASGGAHEASVHLTPVVGVRDIAQHGEICFDGAPCLPLAGSVDVTTLSASAVEATIRLDYVSDKILFTLDVEVSQSETQTQSTCQHDSSS